jgi:uncharacterized protein (TIGR02453 family)
MTDFSGFSQDALAFLAELDANNNRDWFEGNRSRYEAELLVPGKAFVRAMADGMRALDPSLRVEPKVNGSIFRINRDTRFSKDKRPYKTEFSFRFPAAGPKGEVSGFMMRIRPDMVGLACGIWGFEKPALQRFRESVADDVSGPTLTEILESFRVNGCDFLADSYKRVPAPWPKDHPRAHLLKMKGLIAGSDSDVPPNIDSAGFVDWCVEGFGRLAPLHEWLSAHVAG